jgi:hypothetical protein
MTRHDGSRVGLADGRAQERPGRLGNTVLGTLLKNVGWRKRLNEAVAEGFRDGFGFGMNL